MDSKPRDLLEALNRPGILPDREAAALNAWAETFFGFQRKWLFEPSRLAAVNKSRQVGFSHASSAQTVLYGAFMGQLTTIVSIGQRESDEVLLKAKQHAEVLSRLGSTWAAHKSSATEIEFKNGGRIVSLPASSGGRGQSGNVLLDEFAYHEAPDKVWDGAGAAAMHGYRVRVVSTPNGVGNRFHKLITDPRANRGWAIHTVSVYDAIRDGMTIDLDYCRSLANGDPRLFAQWYECSFLDGELQYIPTPLVKAAVVEDTRLRHAERFGGLDIGLVNDASSLTTLAKHADGSLWEQETLTFKRTDWEEQMIAIDNAFDRWGWSKIAVDRSGLGRVPTELLMKRYGRSRVIPYDFTNQSKETLATGLYQAFADKALFIKDNPEMIRDICAIRRIVTTAGNIRYDAPRTSEGHADRAWSLALAIYASGQRAGERMDFGFGDFENS